MKNKTCPKCGSAYSYVERKRVSGRVYLYAIHPSGGKSRRRCYLGPAEGYEYVDKMERLGLKGLHVGRARFLEYFVRAGSMFLVGAPLDLEELESHLDVEGIEEEYDSGELSEEISRAEELASVAERIAQLARERAEALRETLRKAREAP